MSRAVVLGLLGAAGALLVLWWQYGVLHEYVKFKRDAITSSPGLSALFSREVVLLGKGKRACLEPVTFAPDTGQARVRLRAPKAPSPKVSLEMRAGDYDQSIPIPPLDPKVEGTASVEFPRPTHEVTGRFCFHNHGPTPIQLLGTNEGRSLTPVRLTIDGVRKRGADLELVLLESGHHSVGSRRSQLIDRAATFTGGIVQTWLLWPIAVAMFVLPLIVAVLFGLEVWRGERVSRGPDGPRAADPR